MSITLQPYHTITVQDIEFTVRPFELPDILVASDRVRSDQIDDAALTEAMLNMYSMARRIVRWSGPVLADGSAAPCTPENVLALFAQLPDVLPALVKRLAEIETAEKKKCEST